MDIKKLKIELQKNKAIMLVYLYGHGGYRKSINYS